MLFLVLPLIWLMMALAIGAPLDGRVEAEIRGSGAASRALWGVYAKDLASGQVLADVNGQKLFIPASNRKLVSTAMAARYLKDEALVTVIHVPTIQSGGVVPGDLVVEAVGDPTWNASFLRAPGRSQLTSLARQVAQSGVRRVTGNLVIDASRFTDPAPEPETWTLSDFQANYGAIASVFGIDRNLGRVTLTPTTPGNPIDVGFVGASAPFKIYNLAQTGEVDSAPTIQLFRGLDGEELEVTGRLPKGSRDGSRALPLGRPVEFAAKELYAALAEEGVTVDGSIVIAESDRAEGQVIAEVRGAALGEILEETNLESDNYLAESLYLLAGRELFAKGSYEASHAAEKTFWRSFPVESDEWVGEDGSGLSRRNLITPHALVELLGGMNENTLFVNSLPVSGHNGTLRYRLSKDGMAGKVMAKTGTLTGVTALSGYITPGDGRVVAFSVLVNNHASSSTPIRRVVDEIVMVLAGK